jgi:hypothetical protein
VETIDAQGKLWRSESVEFMVEETR